jgi:hypothetical protein
LCGGREEKKSKKYKKKCFLKLGCRAGTGTSGTASYSIVCKREILSKKYTFVIFLDILYVFIINTYVCHYNGFKRD